MWEIIKFLFACFLVCCLVSACAFVYMMTKGAEEFIAEDPEDERWD